MNAFRKEQLFAVQPMSNKPGQKYVLYHKHVQYERGCVM